MKYLLDNFSGKIAKPRTSVEIKNKGSSLVFSFAAEESSLFSYSKKNNDDLWKGSVVEVFLDLGDKDFYYEFEVAPNGATFIAKKYIDHLEFIENNFFKSTTSIKEKTYIVEMEIDLSKLRISNCIRYNCFRIENECPKEKSDNLSALSPTLCDTFHIRDKFLDL